MATQTFTCSVCDNNLPHTDLAEFKKTKLFCNICDLLYCSVCNLVQKDERSFSNKQLGNSYFFYTSKHSISSVFNKIDCCNVNVNIHCRSLSK